MGAAKDLAIRFHSVPDDPAAAVDAARGQGVNGALETVESVHFAVEMDLQRFVVFVATDFTSCHDWSPWKVLSRGLSRSGFMVTKGQILFP
jgi:hypothetical protein